MTKLFSPVRASLLALLTVFSLSACNGTGVPETTAQSTVQAGPARPNHDPSAPPRTYVKDVLLFVGSGTWSAEVASLKNILSSNGATYDSVTSAQLNALSLDQISSYGAIVFPGGSGGTEAGSLSSATKANIRAAVQERGLGYVGFCAGAFIAQAPAPRPGGDVSYGIGVVDGPVLEYYYLEYEGNGTAMTLYSFANGTTADILYYGGPVTPEEPRGVVARYPNGDPSISEMWSGEGLVVITGGHPTATQSMLSSLGVSSSDGIHTDVAWDMIAAAVHQQPLPSF